MSLIGMHATVGNQTKEVKLAATGARVLHRVQQNGILKEVSVLDHQLDARGIHVHNSTRADIQMSDFAVAHLTIRQPDIRAAGLNQRVGILAQQAVVNRLAGERDGVGFGFGSVSPAVEDDEN